MRYLLRALALTFIAFGSTGCLTTIVSDKLFYNSCELRSVSVKGGTEKGTFLLRARYSELRWWLLELTRSGAAGDSWRVSIAESGAKVDPNCPVPIEVSLHYGMIRIVEKGKDALVLDAPQVPLSAMRYIQGAVILPVTVAVDLVTVPIWGPFLLLFWPEC